MKNFKAKQKIAKSILTWYDDYVDRYFDTTIYQFGHTKAKHVNIPDSELKKRACREKLVFASSFEGMSDDSLVNMFVRALHTYKNEVALYLADTDDSKPYELYVDTDRVIGKAFIKNYQLHDWKEGPKKCTEYIILINHRKGGGFNVLTCYPITEEFCFQN